MRFVTNNHHICSPSNIHRKTKPPMTVWWWNVVWANLIGRLHPLCPGFGAAEWASAKSGSTNRHVEQRVWWGECFQCNTGWNLSAYSCPCTATPLCCQSKHPPSLFHVMKYGRKLLHCDSRVYLVIILHTYYFKHIHSHGGPKKWKPSTSKGLPQIYKTNCHWALLTKERDKWKGSWKSKCS